MKKSLRLLILLFLFAANLNAQNFQREIKLTKPRMNGSDVVQLQKMLLSFGYSEVGEADGYFGPKSQEALTQYQAFFGISNQGVFNKQTYNLMFSSEYINLQYNFGIQQINKIMHNPITYNLDVDISDKDYAERSEGAALTNYYNQEKLVYSALDFYGSISKGEYRLYPLNNGDFIIVKEIFYYKEVLGPVDYSQIEETYFYLDGKLYSVKNGTFTENKTFLSDQAINDLIEATKVSIYK